MTHTSVSVFEDEHDTLSGRTLFDIYKHHRCCRASARRKGARSIVMRWASTPQMIAGMGKLGSAGNSKPIASCSKPREEA
jgi:hypothetical protein